jgi:hypothetical protein
VRPNHIYAVLKFTFRIGILQFAPRSLFYTFLTLVTMVNRTHLRRQRLKNRQAIPNVPNVSGINQSSALVLATSNAASAGSLVLDTAATASATGNSVPLAGSSAVVFTSTVVGTTSPTGAPPNASSSTASAVGATGTLSVKTVVASCIAALAGAVLLIIIGLALYRRYIRSLKNSCTLSKGRNAAREAERRRSHIEPWSRMGDEKSGTDSEAPMDKMFKKSPSVRTVYTHKSEEHMTLEMPQSFAQYYPGLASKSSKAVTVHRPFLGRADSGPTISWDADMVDDVASQQLSTSPADNTASIAIPTPVATRTLHRWQSAEVVNPDAEEKASNSNPFETEAERRKSSNPFFKGTDYAHMRSRSNSMASLKSKERSSKAASVASDATFVPKPPFTYQASSSSREEALNNSRAIESLIRALDVTEEDIQDRLRVVSMQPSVLTMESMYTMAGAPRAVTTPSTPSEDSHATEHHRFP